MGASMLGGMPRPYRNLESLVGRNGSKTAATRGTWKVRRTEYQQQTRAVVNDSRLSVAARATWTRGLRTKHNLTRAASTVATLLRTEHITLGLNDYVSWRRVLGHSKSDYDCGWPRLSCTHDRTGRNASRIKDDRLDQATIREGGRACVR